MRFTPEENTAHHEAGHAVANVVLDHQILRLSIKLTEKEHGVCEAGPKTGKTSNLEERIVTVLAAQFAEAFVGTPHPAGVQGDELCAECIAKSILEQRGELEAELTDEEINEASFLERRELRWQRDDVRDRNGIKVHEFLIPLRARASRLIQEYESAVKVVAAKLIDKKEFVGVEAHKMVEDAISAA